ncbi:MAG: hypothetical protein CMP36_04355 [Rickettsiales bacterium]|nr:hypothetical protein [Rickettsiales bacterium]|tara:strand:- start:599 stop:3172 length:2574 start_codon:yes stop_codon:yes gene_type:complete
MAKFNEKLSTILNSQLPEFIVADHPRFADFLKSYYQLLESAELKVKNVQNTVGVLIETETGQENNLVYNATRIGSAKTNIDEGDKILLEETEYGKFTVGETIVGKTSGAKAKVLAEDLTNNRLFISAQDKFITDELIEGEDSKASAAITNYRPQPVQNISDLVNFRDPDKAIESYLNNFRNEFLTTLPEVLNSEVNKRNLIKNVKDMYQAKGTSAGHELFFRLLFNEQSETIYPREQLLKTSDGQFNSSKILRIIERVGNTEGLIGRTITGKDSRATAVIENLARFQIGDSTVTELILNQDTLSGTFQLGEEVSGTASEIDDYFIKADITGIPGTKTITNSGSLYKIEDTIKVAAGGIGALFQIADIGSGAIEEIIIDDVGQDYRIGDVLNFDDNNNLGTGVAGFVRVVNGGVANEDNSGDNVILEEETERGDIYGGSKIVQETETGTGDITDIFLSSGGNGYKELPPVSITSATGSGGKVLAYGDKVGKINSLKTIEHGKGYEASPAPTLTFVQNFLCIDRTGTFLQDNTFTTSSGASGKIISLDTNTNVLKLQDVSGTININDTITSQTGGTAKIKKFNLASATVNVVPVTDTDGEFINDDGKLSESTMKIQDSLYYQDFSYVIKVGQSINAWRDAFKKTMHTAGFYFTGQVNIASRINARIKTPVDGVVSGVSEVPFLQVLNTLFSTIFGRRLGTKSDGTTLRANARLAGAIDSDATTSEHFESNTRDLTLQEETGINYLSRVRRNIPDNTQTYNVRQGHAYAGPRYAFLNKNIQQIFKGPGFTVQAFNDIKIIGTRTGLDGQPATFIATSHPDGQNLKTYFTIPSEFASNKNDFSNTVTNFSSTTATFDDTTP